MRFSLVIFDCDGVLVDSEPIAARVFTEAVEREGLSLDVEDLRRRFQGRTMRDCVVELERLLGRPLPEGWLASLQTRTYRAFERELEPVTGVESVLRALPVPYCVASSGSEEKMRVTLGRTGLDRYFRGRVFSADRVARGKPAPDLFLHAAEVLGADPAATAVIEDSAPGIEAARAAGMTPFGYAARTPRAELGPVTCFTDMRALPTLLGI